MKDHSIKRIPLTTVQNCRDLGGYYCSDNKTTKFNRLLRAGIFFGPVGDDRKALAEIPVTTVIDLRGDHEANTAVSAYKTQDNVDYYHFSLLNINPADYDEGDEPLWQVYTSIVDTKKENIFNVLNTIANAKEGAVLYHCSLGKDRTGIISALLLHIAGADFLDIVADYQVSETYLQHFYMTVYKERLLSEKTQKDMETHLHSAPQNMYKLFEHFDEVYGGADNYLEGIGITQEIREKLNARMKDD